MILSFRCRSCLRWMTYLQDKFNTRQCLELCITLYSAHLHLALADKGVHGNPWVELTETKL